MPVLNTLMVTCRIQPSSLLLPHGQSMNARLGVQARSWLSQVEYTLDGELRMNWKNYPLTIVSVGTLQDSISFRYKTRMIGSLGLLLGLRYSQTLMWLPLRSGLHLVLRTQSQAPSSTRKNTEILYMRPNRR